MQRRLIKLLDDPSGVVRMHAATVGHIDRTVWSGQFLRHPPREAETVTNTATGTSQLGRRQFTTAEMLRTPQFYVLYVMFVLMATGGLLVTANAGPISNTWGFSAGALALAATSRWLQPGTVT